DRFVAACQSESIPGTYPYQYGPIFIIMLYTGLRLGEMLKLCWKDVDLKNRRLYVKGNIVTVKDRSENQYDDVENGIKLSRITIEQKSTKTKSGMNRAVPINTKALQAFLILDEMNKSNPDTISPYVVKSKNGSITTISALEKPYDKVLDLAGIEHCGFHSLRHTFASLLFKKGIDVKIVSEILGHSNTSITYNTYVHIINEQKRVAIDLLDDI
ncbi:MAG: site-specific integrase, partial [Oscillospiraceae bacterium]